MRTAQEQQFVDAAEAMPANKFDFSPESLNLPGSELKGVRSFAMQSSTWRPTTLRSGLL